MYGLLKGFTWLLVRLLLSLIFFGTPIIGFWLASSLAAYLGGPHWMAWTAGALLFPIIPGLWELRTWAGRDPERKSILTPLDRLALRTFAIGLLFLAGLLYLYPQTAFVSLSTRGDWMLDGMKDHRADTARRVLLASAGGLEWLYSATKKNPYKELIDTKARQHSEKASQQREQELTKKQKQTAAKSGNLFFKPESVRQQVSTKPSVINESHEVSHPTWPWKQTTVHRAVVTMLPSVETSIESVAQYLAEQETDPTLRIKALHDYVADRVAYDSDSLFAGRYPPQDAQSVFETRKSVCAGYANLLAALAAAIDEKIVVVVGNARDPATGDRLSGSGHAWNAACINDRWYLIDACWDAGSVSREKGFTKGYRTDYLLLPPEVMIEDHFPEESNWQLLEPPLSQGEFLRQPMLRPAFQAAGLTLVSPLRARNEAGSNAVAIVKNPKKLWLMASLEQNGKKIGRSSMATNDKTARLVCVLPDKGVYRLNMFINKQGQFGTYEFVGSVDFVSR